KVISANQALSNSRASASRASRSSSLGGRPFRTTPIPRSVTGDKGVDAGRAARAPDDAKRRGDHDGAGDGQPAEVRERREPVLPGPEQVVVHWVRRVELVGEAGVGSDLLDAESAQRRLLCDPARAVRLDAGPVRS